MKGSKMSHFGLQDHPANLIQLPFVRCSQLPLLGLSAPTQNWNRMLHASAQELQKQSWLVQGSQKHIRQQELPPANPAKGSYLQQTGSMLCVSLACKPHNSDHSGNQCLLDRVAEARRVCKPCCSPGNLSALPCVHMLTEGPRLESEIYFRSDYGDSSWMGAQTWNPHQIFICFITIKR